MARIKVISNAIGIFSVCLEENDLFQSLLDRAIQLAPVVQKVDSTILWITQVIINITIFSNLIGALTALFFTNYCVGLKSDSWL